MVESGWHAGSPCMGYRERPVLFGSIYPEICRHGPGKILVDSLPEEWFWRSVYATLCCLYGSVVIVRRLVH